MMHLAFYEYYNLLSNSIFNFLMFLFIIGLLTLVCAEDLSLCKKDGDVII